MMSLMLSVSVMELSRLVFPLAVLCAVSACVLSAATDFEEAADGKLATSDSDRQRQRYSQAKPVSQRDRQTEIQSGEANVTERQSGKSSVTER